ncbi:tyrosine-type recombinase/integrase [Tsuneonella sp. HG094]
MTTPDLPANVNAVRDRHGKLRYRFRRSGWPSRYLPGEPNTAEFHAALAELLTAGPTVPPPVASARPVTPRSLDDLFARMKKTPRWERKADNTKHVHGRIIERFLDRVDRKGRRYGERPAAAVTVAWLDAILAGMADTPGAANVLRKMLSGLMDQAIRLRWRTDNPARLTEKFPDGKGFHTWTDAEIALYRAAHPLGSMARLVLELALNTAARRCNVAKLTREDLQGGRIVVAHAKDNEQTSVPMTAACRAALDALPAAPIRYLVTTQFGKPFTDAGLGNRMRKWCDDADLPNCTLHGLRKATSRRLAESGATDAEGQAVTGHKKPATFAKYRAQANRPALADRALSNLEELALSNPPQNDDKTGA